MDYKFNLVNLCKDLNNQYKLKSKVGGKIYLPNNIEIPKDQYGEDMVMLFQLNLKDLKVHSDLPKEGIMLFFIAKDGNSSIDFTGESNDLDDYRIIYFKEDTSNLSEYENGFENNDELELKFSEKIDTLYDGVIEFYREYPEFDYNFMEVVNNKELFNKIDWDAIERINDKHVIFENGNHKVLGVPTLGQDDFRRNNEKYKDYILLLQLECAGDENLHKLGNYGNITFFIHPDDLKNMNFKNCVVNYDAD